MSEPKFWEGDKLSWPDGPVSGRIVTVQEGPFLIEDIRQPLRNWGGKPVYLCKLPDGTKILIGESKLYSHWDPCPGEHRKARDGGWEKLG